MMGTIRIFMLVQAAIFGSAALIHSGRLLEGYQDQAAGTAESIIGLVLLIGLLLSWVPAPWGRRAAIAAQVFALLGTLLGAFIIAIGVGPRTPLDIAYHGLMLAVLIAGLVVSGRSRRSGGET
jgi:hypothetical protein